MTLIKRIKLLCTQAGITISKIERELNFGRGSIYNWDKNSPSVDKVQKVAGYFNVSIDYLLGLEVKKKMNKNDEPFTQKEVSFTYPIIVNSIKRKKSFFESDVKKHAKVLLDEIKNDTSTYGEVEEVLLDYENVETHSVKSKIFLVVIEEAKSQLHEEVSAITHMCDHAESN